MSEERETVAITEDSSDPSTTKRRYSIPIFWLIAVLTFIIIVMLNSGCFGYKSALVTGVSMEPLLEHGDLAFFEPVDPSEIQVGNVIRYDREENVSIVHRVVEIKQLNNGRLLFITKGDNNNVTDKLPVKEEQIEGRLVAYVPNVGWIAIWLQSFAGALR